MEEPIASGSESENGEDIVTIGEISYNKTKILGESLATVYEGRFNSEKVAVKRIKAKRNSHDDTSEDNLVKLTVCPYIVQLFHVEIDTTYRYYALDWCDGSMDKLFLPDCYKTYSDILPDGHKVLLQLAEGLEYIHSKKIVHLDIKPQNVLFSIIPSTKKETLIFKWADFGQSKLIREDGNVFISDATGGRPGTLHWTAPEILDLGNNESNTSTSSSSSASDSSSTNDLKISVECDIWSAGCVFFYYITEGKHPFGDLNVSTSQIPLNVMEGNPVNIKELLPENYGFEMLILNMVKKDPKSRTTLKEIIEYLKSIGYILPLHAFKNPEEKKIRIMNRKFRLGCTTFSRNDTMFTHDHDDAAYEDHDEREDDFRVDFLRGIFGDDSREVAVKRIHHKRYIWDAFGEQKLRSLSLGDEHCHENVLRLLHSEHHQFYEGVRYFAFELCAGSLDHLFLEDDHPKKYRGPPLPSSDIVLTSLIQGLNYIHSKGLIHIRIKPQNVLISLTQPVVMKWADFGLFDVTIGMINSSNTKKWFAPEIIKEIDKKRSNNSRKLSYFTRSMNKAAADVWSTGAVFYYYLTEGKHPSEDLEVTSWEHFPPDVSNFLNDDGHFFARDVITKMMTFNPEERIKLVPDAVEQLESNWKSCNDALTRTLKEKEILKLCSVSEPLERDVDRLCQLFNEEGIDLNCTSAEGDTPLSLLCSSLKESNEHFRSLSTLLQRINMKRDAEGRRIQPKELQQLLEHLRAKNQLEETRLHKLMRRAYRDPGWFLKDAVQFFIDHIPDCLNAKDSIGRTVLHWLCERSGNENILDIIKLLKRRNIKLDAGVDEEGFTALHLLCKNDRCDNLIDIIRELINDTDLHLNAIDDNRKTILHYLCEKYKNQNLVNIVQLLIEKRIDVNARDSNGDTAVQHLVQKYPHNDEMNQIIQLFIDNGCESAQVCRENILYNKDSDINVKILHLESKNDEIFNDIIARFKHYPGNSSLVSDSPPLLTNLCKIYGEENSIEIIKECIRRGYDFTASQEIDGGDTEVHHLCKYYKKESLLIILKELFADGGVHVHIKGEGGNTFLHCICKCYNGDNILNIIEMLVKDCGADPNARNDHRRTPLYFLCICCRKTEDISIVDVIRRFIEIGADPKIRDHNKMTTLHALCRSYQGTNIFDIIELLIEKGVDDLNARDTYGETALGYLCENYPHEEELFKTVQLFMNKGFDMNGKNKVPKCINNKTSIFDCLDKNSNIENKERIAKLLLGDISDD